MKSETCTEAFIKICILIVILVKCVVDVCWNIAGTRFTLVKPTFQYLGAHRLDSLMVSHCCCVIVLVLIPQSGWHSGRLLLEECLQLWESSVLVKQVFSDIVLCRHCAKLSGENRDVISVVTFLTKTESVPLYSKTWLFFHLVWWWWYDRLL